MKLIKKNIFLVFAILISFFSIVSLLHSGFFPIHDDEQVARLFELNYDVQSLHLPPRLSQNLGFGYDYPFFNFYPPFVYYFAEIFVLLGFSYIVSIKIMIAFGFIFASVFMYLFSRRWVGEIGGLVAATLYTYGPYHSIDVYVRGALPEFWAFVFVPAVFWGVSRLNDKQTYGNIILLGFFGAGLMLTHNLVALMIVPFILIFFLFTLYKNKNRKSYFGSVTFGGIVALLLSAYFWIPAILENKFTMVSLLTKELANYKLHFVSLPQFINSAWGYGGSILGPYDGFSLEVGKLHLILIAIALAFYIVNYLRNKSKHGILAIFFIMFALSIFLQSYYSDFVWKNIKALSYLQFPWRFMLFSVFTSSFIAGYLFVFKFNTKSKYFVAGIIIIGTILFYSRLFVPSNFNNLSDKDYTAKDVIRWKTSAIAFEYVPYGIATKKSDLNTTIVDIDQSQIAKTIATPLNDGVIINSLSDKPQYKKFEATSLINSKIQINTFSFPGWKVFINGAQISYNDEGKLKLITIDIPSGASLIEAKFTDTKVRQFANLLSILGLIIVVLMSSIYKRRIKL